MKKYGIPALLSLFVPGFGQLVKGHFGKMILINIIALFLLVNFFYGFILGDSEYLLGFTSIAYYVLNAVGVYDAYNAEDDLKDKTLGN